MVLSSGGFLPFANSKRGVFSANSGMICSKHVVFNSRRSGIFSTSSGMICGDCKCYGFIVCRWIYILVLELFNVMQMLIMGDKYNSKVLSMPID